MLFSVVPGLYRKYSSRIRSCCQQLLEQPENNKSPSPWRQQTEVRCTDPHCPPYCAEISAQSYPVSPSQHRLRAFRPRESPPLGGARQCPSRHPTRAPQQFRGMTSWDRCADDTWAPRAWRRDATPLHYSATPRRSRRRTLPVVTPVSCARRQVAPRLRARATDGPRSWPAAPLLPAGCDAEDSASRLRSAPLRSRAR